MAALPLIVFESTKHSSICNDGARLPTHLGDKSVMPLWFANCDPLRRRHDRGWLLISVRLQ